MPVKFYYVLTNCVWVAQKKKSTVELYMDDPLRLTYKGKRVKVEGRVYVDDSSPSRYMIHVCKLEVINGDQDR